PLHVAQPTRTPLVPYTTLFRSVIDDGAHRGRVRRVEVRTDHLDALARERSHRLVGRPAVRGERHLRTCGGEVLHHPEADADTSRSEEHTSELQSRENLVCRLLL